MKNTKDLCVGAILLVEKIIESENKVSLSSYHFTQLRNYINDVDFIERQARQENRQLKTKEKRVLNFAMGFIMSFRLWLDLEKSENKKELRNFLFDLENSICCDLVL
jgi:hypothetical protein